MDFQLRLSLSPRDNEILDSLTLRVRLLSVSQVARTWWAETANPEANATERLKLLEKAGLVQRFTAMARPELPLEAPIVVWEVGQAPPDFGAASYRLQARFTAALQKRPCVIATRMAGARFGGKGGRLPRKAEQTHDIHMAAVFLRYRSLHPNLIEHWQSEEIIKRDRPAKKGEKLPDAMIRTGTWDRVVEFGGEYNRDKLIAFHDYCAEKGFPYEIW